MSTFREMKASNIPFCTACHDTTADIMMRCYAKNNEDLLLCVMCATQLARKLLEDICATNGDRYG